MQQIFNYSKADFDTNGFDKKGKIFTDFIQQWEIEFHNEFKAFFANYLLGNYVTMQLVRSCFDAEDLENFGMDGDHDFETNLKIDKHRKEPVVYAIASELNGNKEEPLFMSEESTMADGMIILKYVPDNDDETETENPSPTVGKRVEVLINKLR